MSVRGLLVRILSLSSEILLCLSAEAEKDLTMSEFSDFKTLKEFGYEFNPAGELKQIKSGEPFKFEVKPGDKNYNQEHYEALGEVLNLEVYRLLEEKGGLKKLYLNQELDSFIFVSKDYAKKDKLLLLIHGSGVVRAGQWARRLIINNDLDKGTQLPYIEFALKEGFGVIVLNTNQNTYLKDEKELQIPESSSPEEHASTVWNRFVRPANADDVVIVAHSYGGVVALNLATEVMQEFMNRVSGVLLTDSVHHGLTGKTVLDTKLRKISKNYVASYKPVGETVYKSKSDIVAVSAGHEKHEWTSWSAMLNIFQDIRNIFQEPDQTHNKDQTEL